MHKLLNKYLFLADVGGMLYVLIELAWRVGATGRCLPWGACALYTLV